jgi:hypothetical protein
MDVDGDKRLNEFERDHGDSSSSAGRRPSGTGRPHVVGPWHRGEAWWWRVGGDRVELVWDGRGWTARVSRGAWGNLALDLVGHFESEAEALAWCRRMADTLAADLEDESGG